MYILVSSSTVIFIEQGLWGILGVIPPNHTKFTSSLGAAGNPAKIDHEFCLKLFYVYPLSWKFEFYVFIADITKFNFWCFKRVTACIKR